MSRQDDFIAIKVSEDEDSEDIALKLEHIAKLIREGYLSGRSPNWQVIRRRPEGLLRECDNCKQGITELAYQEGQGLCVICLDAIN